MEQLRNPETIHGLRRPEKIKDYQPVYPDQSQLVEALDMLRDTTPVTTFQNIDSLRQRLAEVHSDGAVYIVGQCSNPVRPDTPPDELVSESLTLYETVREISPDSEIILRDARGQSAKPRSNDIEIVEIPGKYSKVIAKSEVYTYRGDMINGLKPTDRTPDPSRMVITALQALDVEMTLSNTLGHHIPHAHEALLMPYEQTFLYQDNEDKYLLSADLPWIGERTRDPDGPHVKMLAEVENPVGVKISSKATEQDIERLAEKLNPGAQPGKLVFMLRLGLGNTQKLPEILEAIQNHAPESLIMCDPMHGNTKNLNGTKTRLMNDIIEEIRTVAGTCQLMGLRLHGIHLEATSQTDIKQCIDHPDEKPSPSDVDPNLNLDQLRRVIRETKDYL